MELAFGLIALGSCIGCTVVGCTGRSRIRSLEARIVVIEREKQQAQQFEQMKQLVHETVATYQVTPQPLNEKLLKPVSIPMPVPVSVSVSHEPVSFPPVTAA